MKSEPLFSAQIAKCSKAPITYGIFYEVTIFCRSFLFYLNESVLAVSKIILAVLAAISTSTIHYDPCEIQMLTFEIASNFPYQASLRLSVKLHCPNYTTLTGFYNSYQVCEVSAHCIPQQIARHNPRNQEIHGTYRSTLKTAN